MFGRRAYPRFGQVAAADGQVRILRDVVVESDERMGVISVLSESRVAVGEQLTLALVNGAGGLDLRVTVLESRPYLAEGRLRHRLRLEILSGGPVPE